MSAGERTASTTAGSAAEARADAAAGPAPMRGRNIVCFAKDWFEDPADPWVIDPTGAMTTGMPRMSEMPEWVPLKIFSDVADWSVRDGRYAAAPH